MEQRRRGVSNEEMPIRFLIDPGRHQIRVALSGVVTREDLRAYFENVRSNPRAELDELIDLTEADPSAITSDQIAAIAHAAREIEPGTRAARVAIVAPGDVAFGLARMYEAQQDRLSNTIRVFRDLAEAEEWLALENGV